MYQHNFETRISESKLKPEIDLSMIDGKFTAGINACTCPANLLLLFSLVCSNCFPSSIPTKLSPPEEYATIAAN